MAYVNALCRRLKNIFSVEKAAQKGIKKGGEDGVNVTIEGLSVDVNPYAPVIEDLEISWVRVEKEEISKCHQNKNRSRSKSKNKKRTNNNSRLTIRKVLCFSSTESAAGMNSGSLASSCQKFSVSSDQSVISLRNGFASRYRREFHEIEMIGSGGFGTVYRCVNRMDGCVYAIKRSQLALAKSKYARKRVSNEVHANAMLNNSKHVVRYFSAWIENDCMYIQQEYCHGGDLAVLIDAMRREKSSFEEKEICRLALHMAKGLRYIHGSKLAHLDIKPENIFISSERVFTGQNNDEVVEKVLYKIGDLGHVLSVTNVIELEDEGDCRYLSKEILQEDYTDLTKADIFSLALTLYEACDGTPLPKNGAKWHKIREGKLHRLKGYSSDLNELLVSMLDLNPKRRPSAANLLQCELLKVAAAIDKL